MISRTGHAALRKALYMPGLVALRHNPILQVFGARMKTNGLAPKAVVGAAMRKLAHLIYGVVKSGKPFDVNFAMNGLAIQDGIWPRDSAITQAWHSFVSITCGIGKRKDLVSFSCRT